MDSGISIKDYLLQYTYLFIYTYDHPKAMARKKTSLTLDEKLWNDFQTYALKKHGNSRNANTEMELAMREYLKNHPFGKRQS